MRLPAIILAAAVLSLASGSGAAAPTPEEAALVGSTVWPTNFGVFVCRQPSEYEPSKTCPRIKTGSMKVLSVSQDYLGRTVYVVEAEGATGYASGYELKYYTSRDDPAVVAARAKARKISADAKTKTRQQSARAECERRGGVSVGMARSEVFASCWGPPKRTNRTVTAEGVREQLIYPGQGFIYLSNGVVTTIQMSD